MPKGTTSSPAASSASTTSASSTARSRCRPAAISSRPTARRGWRSTAHHAVDGAGARAKDDPAYEDIASKFFEHFVAIADAMNTLGGTRPVGRGGRLLLRPAARRRTTTIPLARALAGRPDAAVRRRGPRGRGDRQLPGFKKRCDWFLENRKDLARHISYLRRRRAARPARASPAGDSVARAPRARAALHARREPSSSPVRHPLALRSSIATIRTSSTPTASELPRRLRARRIEHRALRRQLQLARARLVPDELPAGRGARALPPLLRRQLSRWSARPARARC